MESEMMYNLFGVEAEIVENRDGSATVLIWDSEVRMASVDVAVQELLHRGFRF